ncbi:sulfatase [Psychrosphaera sp. B3R10]|uniref:sulfatase family protein n=1 Tax=unclassified Psychrosphaera TaxID=2641570 RepID=UPI001C08DE90|nr:MULTISPECIES: sulfatase [unclassified Psychrosphaera]MBU2883528.1 sulfatase [Psychrosphaera sp. I2R16]MBU2989707.1 sulfatase [Psychrosphaera sp. B3R10]MDO6719839.1 sulfatase [Psychrosphaera sp. 1_MG-2023]
MYKLTKKPVIHFKKGLLKISCVTLTALALVSCYSSTTHTNSDAKNTVNTKDNQKQPNILFILADDHRWDLIGKYHSIIKTPTLDQLANQGTVFKNAFVTTPICASSRISILTGLTERTHDFTFSRPKTGKVESANMYPAILKKNGYRSALVGKYEINMSGQHKDRFDYFKPLLHEKTGEFKGKNLPQTYYIAELAKDFIEQSKNTNQPWTMSVNFWNPHALDKDKEDQFHYPPEFENYYSDVTIPPAKLSDNEYFEQLPEFLQLSIGRVRWEYRFSNEAMYQKMVKRHYRAISSVDKAVSMLIQKLEETGMADNTIIIYTGDNGYALNERQLAGKWFGWEEDLRVPLIIYDPRNKQDQAKEITKMVLNIDIAPTILSLAGVDAPQTYQGKSLLPMLNDSDEIQDWRTEFMFEHMYQPKRVFIPPVVGVRTEDWKYFDFHKQNHERLYDLKNDPDETTNLANDPKYQHVLKTLSEKTDLYIKKYEQARTDEVKQRPSFLNQRN